jgi:tetratricopeptide (TPR) repeat protein
VVAVLMMFSHAAGLAGQEPTEREEEVGRGILLAEIGRHSEAVEWLRQVVERYPDDARAYANLGVALLQIGDTNAAIQALEQAVELAPDNALFRKNLGNTYTDARRYDDAIAQHREAIELEPASAGHHIDLGVAFASSGHLDSAIAEMQAALSRSPNHVLALMNLTLYHGQRQEWMEALEAQIRVADANEWHPEHTELASSIAYEIRERIEEEVEARPEDPVAHYRMAYVKNFNGDYKGAAQEAERAVKLDPSVAEFGKARGLFESHRGKHGDARKALERCIEVDPEYWQCHAWLGFTHILLEQFDDAVGPLKRAVELAPDAINPHLQLGVAYQVEERYEDSAVHFQKAIDLGMGDPMTQFNLAVAYYYMDHQLGRAWVHATIAAHLGFGDAVGLVDHLEDRLGGPPNCYGDVRNMTCARP